MNVKRKFLNVGGHSKEFPVPKHYEGWEHHLLDIDPKNNPDIVMDAKDMKQLQPAQYDAIYCSHTLEHFYFHEVLSVLEGFRHVLKPDGFAEIAVPDLDAAFKAYFEKKLDVDQPLYNSPAGPITILDMLYGHRKSVAEGDQYFAHKIGFTINVLLNFLKMSGFKFVMYNTGDNYEIRVVAFLQEEPSGYNKELFKIQ